MAYIGGVYEVKVPVLVLNIWDIVLALLAFIVLALFTYYMARYYVRIIELEANKVILGV